MTIYLGESYQGSELYLGDYQSTVVTPTPTTPTPTTPTPVGSEVGKTVVGGSTILWRNNFASIGNIADSFTPSQSINLTSLSIHGNGTTASGGTIELGVLDITDDVLNPQLVGTALVTFGFASSAQWWSASSSINVVAGRRYALSNAAPSANFNVTYDSGVSGDGISLESDTDLTLDQSYAAGDVTLNDVRFNLKAGTDVGVNTQPWSATNLPQSGYSYVTISGGVSSSSPFSALASSVDIVEDDQIAYDNLGGTLVFNSNLDITSQLSPGSYDISYSIKDSQDSYIEGAPAVLTYIEQDVVTPTPTTPTPVTPTPTTPTPTPTAPTPTPVTPTPVTPTPIQSPNGILDFRGRYIEIELGQALPSRERRPRDFFKGETIAVYFTFPYLTGLTDWTCTISISERIGRKLRVVRDITDTDSSLTKFACLITKAETDSLGVGEYVLAVEVNNTITGESDEFVIPFNILVDWV